MTHQSQDDNEKNDNVKGDHHGYGGQPGTFILQDGEQVAADPVTFEPLPKVEEPVPAEALPLAPEPVAEKTKPAPKQVEKIGLNIIKTE